MSERLEALGFKRLETDRAKRLPPYRLQDHQRGVVAPVRVKPVRDDGNRALDVPKLTDLPRLGSKLALLAVTDSDPVCAWDAKEDRAGSMLRPGFRAARPDGGHDQLV